MRQGGGEEEKASGGGGNVGEQGEGLSVLCGSFRECEGVQVSGEGDERGR